MSSGGFWLVLVSSGPVLAYSGGVHAGSGEFSWVLVSSGAILVCSGGFWWVLMSSGAVLVCFGVFFVFW